jgi:hypothetical protein
MGIVAIVSIITIEFVLRIKNDENILYIYKIPHKLIGGKWKPINKL